MNLIKKRVEIITFKPDLVTLKDLQEGKTIKVNTRLFERQVNTGAYDVVNPEAYPKIF